MLCFSELINCLISSILDAGQELFTMPVLCDEFPLPEPCYSWGLGYLECRGPPSWRGRPRPGGQHWLRLTSHCETKKPKPLSSPVVPSPPEGWKCEQTAWPSEPGMGSLPRCFAGGSGWPMVAWCLRGLCSSAGNWSFGVVVARLFLHGVSMLHDPVRRKLHRTGIIPVKVKKPCCGHHKL